MKCEGKNKSGIKRMRMKEAMEDQKERKKEQWEDQKERKYNGRTKRMKRTVGRSKE